MPTVPPPALAVVIGRWQIYHRGHASLLDRALAVAPRVAVVIGSALRSRDTRHPFTWQERRQMIEATLSDAQRARVAFVPVRDYYDDRRWNAAVRDAVTADLAHGSPIALVGHAKDASSHYLDQFADWRRESVEPQTDIDAAALRRAYFGAVELEPALAVMEPYLEPAVLHQLRAWACLPAYARLAAEQRFLDRYRQRWTAPWYLTADVVAEVDGHVLLIRRGGEFGHGLWALPGGFVDTGERLQAAAVRELAEETGWRPLPGTLAAAFQGSAVFDHPLRSPRGRLVTQAFPFDFGRIAQPEVRGADDAKEARWIAKADLPALEHQLFEDHATILDHFVGLF